MGENVFIFRKIRYREVTVDPFTRFRVNFHNKITLFSILFVHTVADDDNSDIEQKLDKLENDLMDAIASKTTGQNTIENYRQIVADLNTWFDNMIKKIDAIDVGNGLNCAQKLDAISLIQNECEAQGLKKLEGLKQTAQNVIEIINNLDSQQVEEKLKSSDRRYNDIIKRVARKAQMIAATNKGVQAVQSEIEQLNAWLDDQISNLNEPKALSSESNLLNVHLQKLKATSKDADVKQAQATTIERRVNNMQNDLEPLEKSQLENSLREIAAKQKELSDLIALELDATSAGLQRLKEFETDLDKVRMWLRNKLSDLRKQPSTIPLASKAVENDIQAAKSNEVEISKFKNDSLNEIQKQIQNILKNCSERKPLEGLLEGLSNEYTELKNEAATITKHLTDACEVRKAFENEVSKLEDWFCEVEIRTQADIQIKSLLILEEQLLEFEKVKEQKEAMRPILNSLNDHSKSILPSLNNADKMKLSEQIKALKDKFNKPVISDRIKTIEDHIKRFRNAQDKLSQCIEILNRIEQEMRDLKKPIGIDVDGVKALITTYERILRDLNDNKNKVSAIKIDHLPELSSTLQKHDDNISAVEKQIANLKQAQSLREQYYGQIDQIETMIETYGNQISEIDKSTEPIEEKLNQYSEMTAKIQECEGMLASVHDKGQKIAAEGTIADGNAITEINQKLKQKLQNLHKKVKAQRQKHETMMAEHNKIISELSSILQWLHNNETTCKSRPLLERDPDSVEHETTKHNIFAKEVQDHLDKVQKIDEQIDIESGLQSNILDMLSEGRCLINNLPKELADRKQYLLDSKQSRIDYIEYINEFKDWIHQSEGHLESCKHGIDFENIVSNIDKFNSFFENDRPVKELLTQKIQSTVDQIWPTLQTIEQNELSEEVRQHKKLLEKTLSSAKQHRVEFEKNKLNWDSYRDLFNSCRNYLENVQIENDAADSLPNMQMELKRLSSNLHDLKVSVG